MEQELWLNLPVKDLEKSRAFFTSLGFEPTRDAPRMIGFEIGKVPVMMVEEAQLQLYTQHKVSDTTKGSEFLISVSAPNRAYVDEITNKIKDAGGSVYSEPQEIQGWMYGMAMVDLDGHRWNIIYMDWDKMPKE
ncbi:VOC family protein [Ekhidna sp.]|uniref:VOC family protein n=1 Tax=Ekhidna sp. TaxID=2608089 RepID=UPI0032EE9697